MENRTKEEQKFSLSGTFQKAKEYAETRLDLLKLQTTERVSRLLAGFILDVIKVVFALFIIFYLSLALGFYLSELLGSASLGFLATGGIFIILVLLVMLFHKPLSLMFTNITIRRFLENSKDDDDQEVQ